MQGAALSKDEIQQVKPLSFRIFAIALSTVQASTCHTDILRSNGLGQRSDESVRERGRKENFIRPEAAVMKISKPCQMECCFRLLTMFCSNARGLKRVFEIVSSCWRCRLFAPSCPLHRTSAYVCRGVQD